MAAIISKDPADYTAFQKHWTKLLSDPEVVVRTIYHDSEVVGHIAKFVSFGEPEITYWIGKEHWGKGIATRAVGLFLMEINERPIYARAAKDNIGSIRVLEKCGFQVIKTERGFAHARGEEIAEVVMRLQ